MVFGFAVAAISVFAVVIFSREPLTAVHSTTHPSIDRKQCVQCHAPIAEEWRQSYHFKSLTGPMWKDVRQMGYMKIFDRVRKPCLNCHAPANVLDLPHKTGVTADRSDNGQGLGVECTPNLLKNAKGVLPSVRSDDSEMGVDCVTCHVSLRGIVGAGRRPTESHETLADSRFQDPMITSAEFCITCHGSAVHAWEKSGYAASGVSCLDCHMPVVRAPSISGGPERLRRSHLFPADKDLNMLRAAVEASIEVTPARRAVVRIKNRGVGHYLPSGGNWLLVYFTIYDTSGKLISEERQGLGREEALLFDFWPFAGDDTRIAPGMQREVSAPLRIKGHGRVEAVVRYHDWMRVNPTLLKLVKAF
jgi:hypothetical protein